MRGREGAERKPNEIGFAGTKIGRDEVGCFWQSLIGCMAGEKEEEEASRFRATAKQQEPNCHDNEAFQTGLPATTNVVSLKDNIMVHPNSTNSVSSTSLHQCMLRHRQILLKSAHRQDTDDDETTVISSSTSSLDFSSLVDESMEEE